MGMGRAQHAVFDEEKVGRIGFCKEATVPKPIEVGVVAKDRWSQDFDTTQSLLSMAEVVESLWKDHRTHFDEIVGTNPREFWDAMDPGDPKFATMTDITVLPGWQDAQSIHTHLIYSF